MRSLIILAVATACWAQSPTGLPSSGGGGSGSATKGINQITGDVTAGPGTGSQAATVVGFDGVPICTGFAPTNLQFLQFTTAASPNPCYRPANGSGSNPFATHAYTGTPTAIDFSSFTNVTVTASGADVTVTISANPGTSGTPITIGLCNDTVARSWASLPGAFRRIGTPQIASTCVYTMMTWDGTNYQGPGTDETPSVQRWTSLRSQPANPPTGTLATWADTTNTNVGLVNAAGSVFWPFLSGIDANPNTGQVTNGSHITNGSIAPSGLTAAANRRTCVIDNDTQSATVLAAANFSGHCVIPAASTIVEVDVIGGTGTLTGVAAAPTVTGTGSIQLGKYTPNGGASTTGLLSGLLAMATGKVCALTGISGTCINGTTSSGTITISTTALAAGDVLYISAATADGVQTWANVTVIYTVN